MPRLTLSLIAFALLPTLALAQLPAPRARASLVVAPDLQVELFAHEPDLVNATSIDVDHLGRVWVCEAVNYRRVMFNRPILREAGDRIIILEDTKGAGKADKSTVFYQGKDLIAPIGICVAPIAGGKPGACKVFVCQSPDILVFEDLDGDGKADGPPRKFLSGFRGIDHDHGVHGINIGPDGKLYFTVGDAGVDGLKSSDGKGRVWKSNSTDCRAGTVWRCDQDGKNLELIAHNFRNNYECCVNSFGEIWLSDNDDDGNQQTRICYVMPGGDYGYHPRGPGQSHWHEEQPGIVHKTLRTGFGSPTGICFYEGTLLPKKYQGQLLHCDAGPREFRCFHIKPKGAGYELEKELLVTSTDSWFRLSDVCVGPDGSVFLADWYDPGVGGHGMGDWTRGRIFRVTPKGHVGYKVPRVDLGNDRGLLAGLGSPNLAARHMAADKIRSQKSDNGLWFVQGVAESTFGIKDAVHFKAALMARAFWLADEMTPDLMLQNPQKLKILSSKGRGEFDNDAIVEMVRLIARRHPDMATIPANAIDILREAVLKSEPPVRREIILTLRDAPPMSATEWIMQLAELYDGKDHFYRAALNIACGTDPKRRDAILVDFDKHFPEWNDKVADLVWELRPKSVLPRLEKLLVDGKLTAAQKGRIVDILAVYDDPATGKSLLTLLSSEASAEVKARALENLRQFLPTKWSALAKSEELRSIIGQLLGKPQTVSVGLQLVAATKYIAVTEQVAKIAAERNVEAIRTLGKLPDAKAAYELEKILRSAEVVLRSRPDPETEKALTAVQIETVAALGIQLSGPANSEAAKHSL